MKTIFALTVLAISAVAAEPSSKDVAAVVDTWRAAMLKGDAAALDKLYHADLTYEHSSGKVETKSESIANATKPGSVSKDIQFHDPAIHIYGNTATYRAIGDFTNASGAVSHLNVLMVWIRFPQGWQLVARQSTKIQ
jgi:ketosteroid isomerase-like protein